MRCCISNQLPGNASAARPWTSVEEQRAIVVPKLNQIDQIPLGMDQLGGKTGLKKRVNKKNFIKHKYKSPTYPH